ncbi:hypothetical protein F2B00_03265 [Streptomyces parvus]|nr:hypothetical protein F2B00_03265 [Streptomyces parvus]GGS42116.1 hypothetical protein GCM10010221_46280 [Streptomyces parvus]
MPSTTTIKNCRLEPAGDTWDAVRVPRSVGSDAVAILGSRAGAALQDPHEGCLYFFIAPGTADSWKPEDAPGARILGAGSHVVFPPPRRTQGPGPHWRICPGDDGLLTDTAALRAALEDAASAAVRR